MTEWRVGQLVSVEARTGPGMNQPGGVARIVSIARDDEITTGIANATTDTDTDTNPLNEPLTLISVKYVVSGNHEKNVDSRHIQPHEWETTLRDRTHNAGRCPRCGSLRKDCGFCDETYGIQNDSILGPSFRSKQHQHQHQQTKPPTKISTDRPTDTSDDSSDDESVYLETMIAKNRRDYLRYLRLRAKSRKFYSADDLFTQSPNQTDNVVRRIQRDRNQTSRAAKESSHLSRMKMQEAAASASSDESNGELTAKPNAAQRTLPTSQRLRSRRDRHSKSVLETQFPRSSSDDTGSCSDDDIPLDALRKSNKPFENARISSPTQSVASMVSNPGSPDCDSDARESTAPISIVNTYYQHLGMSQGTAVELDESGDDEGFIQPEGRADQLPADVYDATADLNYTAIIPFFDEAITRLERDAIPLAKQQAIELEREWTCMLNSKHSDRHSRHEVLRQKSLTLYDELKRTLVRNGKDQCQNALRKMTSRAFHRRCRAEYNSSQPFPPFVDHDDMREFKFDAIKETVDCVMAKVRNLAISDVCDQSVSGSSESGTGSEGWVFPESHSTTGSRFSDGSDFETRTIEDDKHAMDLHPHASKKRKETTAMNQARQKKPARASRNKRRKTTGIIRSEVRDSFQWDLSKENGASCRRSTAMRHRSKGPRNHRSTINRKVSPGKSEHPNVLTLKGGRISSPLGMEQDDSRGGASRLSDSSSSDSTHHDGRGLRRKHHEIERQKGTRRRSTNVRNVQTEKTSTSFKLKYPKTRTITRASLFSLLQNSTPAPLVCNPTGPPSELDLPDLCSVIASSNSKTPCRGVFNNICNIVERSACESDAALSFRTLLEYLISNESRTLQDLISSDSAALEPTVEAWIATLRLLRVGANKSLSPNDGLTFRLFAQDRGSAFVDFVVLQLTDSVMALLQPDAWSLGVKDRLALLLKLGLLRDELARHIYLVERICNCLMRELELQEWRCTRDGDNIFVSAVDPKAWLSYLSSADEPPKPKNVRFAAIGQYMPRNEVEAIWCMLAFFSIPGSSTDSPEGSRWKLLSSILLKGSLSDSADPGVLPPSQDQLDAVKADLTSLDELISSGSLGCIPRRDDFLINVFQRSVLIQSEDLLLGETMRDDFLPSFDTDNGVMPPILRSSSASIQCLLKAMSTSSLELKWMGQPLLLPSSGLLCRCLKLLVSWKNRVGSPKRFLCFGNAMKALMKNFSDTAQSYNADSSSGGGGDVFATAFSPRLSGDDETACRSKRRDLFLHECSAYFSIFASNVLSGETSPTSISEFTFLCKEVWRLLSDDGMRQSVNVVCSENDSPFVGDVSRLRIAAKAMTLLILPAMGVFLPESLVVMAPVDKPLGTTEINCDEATLVFLFTCLLACLDCACRSIQKDPVILIFILNYVRVVVLVARGKHRQSERDALLSVMRDSRILQRCFEYVTTTAVVALHGELFLTIFTDAIKQLIFMVPAWLEPRMVIENRSPNLDSSNYALSDRSSISIESRHATAQTSAIADLLCSLQSLLADAIKKCKPSTRNAVTPYDIRYSTKRMSVQGMKLICKQSENICALLSNIAACSPAPSSQQKALCDVEMRFNIHPDQCDTRYLKGIAQIFTRHLCTLNTSGHVIALVSRSKESILFNLIESLVDVDLLARVPSCNLTRIERSCGSMGEEKGFTELNCYRNGTLDSVNNRTSALRKFCGDLGLLVHAMNIKESHQSNDWLGQLLIEFSVHYGERQNHFGPSLELECLHRLKLFQGLLQRFTTGLCTHNWTNFERLSCLLLASCSSELCRLLQKVGLQDRAHEEVSSGSYKKAKLFEALTSFVGLYASVVATMFRHSSNVPVSDYFREFLSRILNDFISRLYVEQNFPLVSALNANVKLAARYLANGSMATTRAESCTAVFDANPYSDILRHVMGRSMSDFVAFTAANFSAIPLSCSSAFLAALFAFKMSQASCSVKHCFTSTTYYPADGFDDSMHLSPLLDAIQKDATSTEACIPVTADLASALRSLRRFAIQHVLIPNIQNGRQCPASRTNSLQVTSTLLDLECELEGCAEEPMNKTKMPCCVAKGIRSCVLNALTSGVIADEALLSAAFVCATALMAVPVSCTDADNLSAAEENARVDEMPPSVVHTYYLRYFCKWLDGVGCLILNGISEHIHAMRLRFRSLQRSTGTETLWPTVGSFSDGSMVSERLFMLESQIFPVTRLANGVAISNVYTTSRIKRAVELTTAGVSLNDDKLVEWVPSAAVISAITEFRTKATKVLTPSER